MRRLFDEFVPNDAQLVRTAVTSTHMSIAFFSQIKKHNFHFVMIGDVRIHSSVEIKVHNYNKIKDGYA